MNILLLGPQGSGKSTQARLLSKHLNLCFISIGDLVRAKSKENTDEGRYFKEIMERGDLVDDKSVALLFKTKMDDEECERGFVTDSYPRRLSQVKTFDPGIDRVFYLEIPKEEILERMKHRSRVDDTRQAINKRLSIYREETQPLLDYYAEQGNLTRVSGLGTINEVRKRLLEHLDGKK